MKAEPWASGARDERRRGGWVFEDSDLCNQSGCVGDGMGMGLHGAAPKPTMKILMLALLMLSTAACTEVPASRGPRGAACGPAYQAPRRIVYRTEYRWGVDHCGRRYQYPVRVATYAD